MEFEIRRQTELRSKKWGVYDLSGNLIEGGFSSMAAALRNQKIHEVAYSSHLCGDECAGISDCPEEPCHCEVGLALLQERASMRSEIDR